MSNFMNFNIQWDDLLQIEASNANEIDPSQFMEDFQLDPSFFEGEFSDNDKENQNEVSVLTDSQFENHMQKLGTENSKLYVTELTPATACPIDPDNKEVVKGFIEVSPEDVVSFNREQKNKNTARKHTCNMKKLDKFLAIRNEKRKIQNIPMPELDELLSMFILSIRKEDGEEYETTSLRSFVSTIEKELQSHNYPFTIAKGARQGFPKFTETISSKMKKVKKEGKGNRAYAAKPLEDEEITKFYELGLLGNHSPESLINTLWLRFTINFGMRSVEEHYNLCWGDVKLCQDADGDEYLELRERQTKTRTGETKETRIVPPRLWGLNDPTRCPVATYRIFTSKRPHEYCKDSDPLYISTTTKPITHPSDRWFISSRMGMKKIGSLMKNMCAKAGIPRKLTNHSARKHLIQKLRDEGCNPTDIMQISGHKNVQSIINYSNMSMEAQKRCSSILTDSVCSQNKKTKVENRASSSTAPNPESESIATGPPIGISPTHSLFPNMAPWLMSMAHFPNVNMLPQYSHRPMNSTSTNSEPRNEPNVSYPTHQNFGNHGMFFGATVNISSLNIIGQPEMQQNK